MNIIISVFLLLPIGQGFSGVAYPSDIFFLSITPSATVSTEEKAEDIGFILNSPYSIGFLGLRYRNFSFWTDGSSTGNLCAGITYPPSHLSGKLGFFKRGRGVDSSGLSIGAGSFFDIHRFFQTGFAIDFDLLTNIPSPSLIAHGQLGFSFGYSFLRGFADMRLDSIQFEKGMPEPTAHIGLSAKWGLGKNIDSLSISTGIDNARGLHPTIGIEIEKDPFSIYIAARYNTDIHIGIKFSYKKKTVVEKYVKIIEREKIVEKPVVVKDPKKIPEQPKETVKEKSITFEEEKFLEEHYNKGIEFYKKELLENAIQEWEKVYEINPHYKDVKRNIEDARKKLQKLKELKGE